MIISINVSNKLRLYEHYVYNVSIFAVGINKIEPNGST